MFPLGWFVLGRTLINSRASSRWPLGWWRALSPCCMKFKEFVWRKKDWMGSGQLLSQQTEKENKLLLFGFTHTSKWKSQRSKLDLASGKIHNYLSWLKVGWTVSGGNGFPVTEGLQAKAEWPCVSTELEGWALSSFLAVRLRISDDTSLLSAGHLSLADCCLVDPMPSSSPFLPCFYWEKAIYLYSRIEHKVIETPLQKLPHPSLSLNSLFGSASQRQFCSERDFWNLIFPLYSDHLLNWTEVHSLALWLEWMKVSHQPHYQERTFPRVSYTGQKRWKLFPGKEKIGTVDFNAQKAKHKR